jgi:hypothetical protein
LKDKNIEGKFIVLEFLAAIADTCCLSAVPHLNIHDNFKNRKDLLFLSMTLRKTGKKQNEHLKNTFKTVISDQTKLNETNFNVDKFLILF